MHEKKSPFRSVLAGVLTGAAVLVASGGAMAQETQSQKAPVTKRAYSPGRDPFRKYEPPRVIVRKVSGQVVPPSIQERIAQYKAQKVASMNARMPAPRPTTALLLSELQVVGISRTPRGYAAIVEATPIKLSYVIYPGEPFYDGQLVAIEDSRLVFRHETVFTDGHRERSVELKSLRDASSVSTMATANPPAPANVEAQKTADEKPASSEKP